MTDHEQLIADLRAARALIAEPGGWCQGRYYIPAPTPCGEAFCVTGVPRKVARDLGDRKAAEFRKAAMYAALQSGLHKFYYGSLPAWNDMRGRTQADAVALYDAAIAAESKE